MLCQIKPKNKKLICVGIPNKRMERSISKTLIGKVTKVIYGTVAWRKIIPWQTKRDPNWYGIQNN